MDSFPASRQMKQSTGLATQLPSSTNMNYIMPAASVDSKFLKYFPPAVIRYLPGEMISFFSDESDLTHLKQRDVSKAKELISHISKSLADYLKAKEGEYEEAIKNYYDSILNSKSLFHSKAKQFVERADFTISR